ncbi:MAG: hypothetical protein Tsb0034_07920 [Ekhidna sp.]
MTFIDTRHFYLENEELVESKEGEREELKEGTEDKDWIKLIFGFSDFWVGNQSIESICYSYFLSLANTTCDNFFNKQEVPLFLKYCCLKIHLG